MTIKGKTMIFVGGKIMEWQQELEEASKDYLKNTSEYDIIEFQQACDWLGDILDIITKNIKEERAKNEELQNIELTESEGEEQ